MSIILFDICSSPAHVGLSTNVWKTRYCLNFKGLSHTTAWIEAPDIKPLYEKHNIAPNTNPDGTLLYGVPLIYDPSTNKYISDSFAIAEYLDRTYPSPPLFPHSTQALQLPIDDLFKGNILPGFQIFYTLELKRLSPPSAAFFAPKQELAFGGAKDIPRAVLWGRLKDGLGSIAELYDKTDGPFLMGDAASWGDLALASGLVWFKILLGEESSEWRDIISWHGGKWKSLMHLVRPYETVP